MTRGMSIPCNGEVYYVYRNSEDIQGPNHEVSEVDPSIPTYN